MCSNNHIGVVDPGIVSRICEVDMRHRPLSYLAIV